MYLNKNYVIQLSGVFYSAVQSRRCSRRDGMNFLRSEENVEKFNFCSFVVI